MNSAMRQKVPVIYGRGNLQTASVTSIKQIRGFVGFILQPEMKLLENRPRPLINIERDESSQTHLIVSTTCRSFRDKCVFSIADDRDVPIDKVQERAAIKLT